MPEWSRNQVHHTPGMWTLVPSLDVLDGRLPILPDCNDLMGLVTTANHLPSPQPRLLQRMQEDIAEVNRTPPLLFVRSQVPGQVVQLEPHGPRGVAGLQAQHDALDLAQRPFDLLSPCPRKGEL
jgi:hypothetical protein